MLTRSIACEGCNKAKVKCDLQTPCARCIEKGIQCMPRRAKRTASDLREVAQWVAPYGTACEHCSKRKVRCDLQRPCGRCLQKDLTCAPRRNKRISLETPGNKSKRPPLDTSGASDHTSMPIVPVTLADVKTRHVPVVMNCVPVPVVLSSAVTMPQGEPLPSFPAVQPNSVEHMSVVLVSPAEQAEAAEQSSSFKSEETTMLCEKQVPISSLEDTIFDISDVLVSPAEQAEAADQSSSFKSEETTVLCEKQVSISGLEETIFEILMQPEDAASDPSRVEPVLNNDLAFLDIISLEDSFEPNTLLDTSDGSAGDGSAPCSGSGSGCGCGSSNNDVIGEGSTMLHISQSSGSIPQFDISYWRVVMFFTAGLVLAILMLCQPFYLKDCWNTDCMPLHHITLHIHSDNAFISNWIVDLDLCHSIAAASLAGAIVCGLAPLLSTNSSSYFGMSEQFLNQFHDRFTKMLHSTLIVFFPSVIAMHQVWNLWTHHMIKFTIGDMWLTCHCVVSLLCCAYGTSKRCLVVHRFILFFVFPLRVLLGEFGILPVPRMIMLAISPPFSALLQRSRSNFWMEMFFTNAIICVCAPLGVAHSVFFMAAAFGSILLEGKLRWLAGQHKEELDWTIDSHVNESTGSLNLKYLDNSMVLLLISSIVLLVSLGSIKFMGLDSSSIIVLSWALTIKT